MDDHKFRRTSRPFRPTEVTSKHLWHIMPIRKLQTFLDGGLWLARIDQFGDPLEGMLPIPNLGLLNKLPIQAPAILREYELGVKRAYASCWHISEDDPSDHAWAAFGEIGLLTTPVLMKQSLQYVSGPAGPVYFGKIRYVDHWQENIPETNIIEAGFVVQRKYEQEREARVLIHTHGTAAFEYLYNKKGPYGNLVQRVEPFASFSGKHEFVGGQKKGEAIIIKIDPQHFIKELVIHPSISDNLRQQVVAQLRKAGLEAKLRS